MKTTSFILALIISISIGKAQTNHQVSYFSLQDVKLLSSPFLQAQQTDLHYILALDPDRLSAPFLREAGLTSKAPSYTNWETNYTVHSKLSAQDLSEEHPVASNFGKKSKQVTFVPEASA